MDIFGGRSTAEWIEILGRHGIPSGPVNDFNQAFADPQTAARGLLVDVDHPTLGTVRHIASPLRVGDLPRAIRRGPTRGEHTREVFGEVCGYPPDRVEALERAEGVSQP